MFIGGVAYVKWYKINVLNKVLPLVTLSLLQTIDAFVLQQMEKAFAAGYDPSLELAKSHFPERTDSNGETVDGDDHDPCWTEHLRRKEQDTVDHIIHGIEHGHYFMLLGPKVIALFYNSCSQMFDDVLPT